jgi:hypothetical protein
LRDVTTFERAVGIVGGIVVLTLIAVGYGELALPAFVPFMLAITASWWWRTRRVD